jgi:hypothetical protein
MLFQRPVDEQYSDESCGFRSMIAKDVSSLRWPAHTLTGRGHVLCAHNEHPKKCLNKMPLEGIFTEARNYATVVESASTGVI